MLIEDSQCPRVSLRWCAQVCMQPTRCAHDKAFCISFTVPATSTYHYHWDVVSAVYPTRQWLPQQAPAYSTRYPEYSTGADPAIRKKQLVRGREQSRPRTIPVDSVEYHRLWHSPPSVLDRRKYPGYRPALAQEPLLRVAVQVH